MNPKFLIQHIGLFRGSLEEVLGNIIGDAIDDRPSETLSNAWRMRNECIINPRMISGLFRIQCTYSNCKGVVGYIVGSETLGVVCTSDGSEADANDRKTA